MSARIPLVTFLLLLLPLAACQSGTKKSGGIDSSLPSDYKHAFCVAMGPKTFSKKLAAQNPELVILTATPAEADRLPGLPEQFVIFPEPAPKGRACSPTLNFEREVGATIPEGKVFDVLGKPIDWREGHSTFYIGRRQKEFPRADFLARLTGHVRDVARDFGAQGLRGYIVYATPDFEMAFLNWPSRKAADQAFDSVPIKALVKDAETFMSSQLFTSSEPYFGRVRYGKLYAFPKPAASPSTSRP